MKVPPVDEKTHSLLDVSGSCVVDIIYNHIYDRAIAIHEKTSTGLAECYRQSLKEYVRERGNSRFYTVLLNSIHHYTRMSTIYNNISYLECVNLYASLFIPQMYHASLTSEQKINILTMILGDTIEEFASEILQSHISGIIDDHNDPINIEILQDTILKIMLQKREQSYERFIKSQKQQSEVKRPKVQFANKPAANHAIIKLKDAFKKSIHDQIGLKKKNAQLIKKNKELAKQFQDIKAMFLAQLTAHKQQTAVIEELKKQKAEPAQEDEDDFDVNDAFSVQYVEES